MKDLADNIKVSINQNVLVMTIAFIALGLSEFYHLWILGIISGVLSIVMAVSVGKSMVAYTKKYTEGKKIK